MKPDRSKASQIFIHLLKDTLIGMSLLAKALGAMVDSKEVAA
jgi:hypothetical protein